MSARQLEKIRDYELDRVLELLPKGGRILELGAGSGWQAKRLAELSFDVEAIDLPNSTHKEGRVWPILEYDGHRIPFPDHSFDVVFSSNVLEHIPHVEAFQVELRRVLKPAGLCIHVLPTASWRFWSTISHYLFLVKVASSVLLPSRGAVDDSIAGTMHRAKQRSRLENLRRLLLPPRHGETGNVLSELYLFSRFRWRPFFRSTGWSVKRVEPNRLFYTGYSVLDERLRVETRRLLSYVMGSSCQIFVLEPGLVSPAREGTPYHVPHRR